MSKYHVGKNAERQLAKRLKAKRNWQAQAQGGADLHSEWFCVEVFVRKQPEFLKQELEQAVKDASPRQMPIVVWHEKGKSYDEDLVIMRLKDFENETIYL